jgi:probable phosphoglycerate mutase
VNVADADRGTVPEGIRQYRFTPPPGATTVLLVRHGESAPARRDVPFPLLDGHGDPPLSPEGEEQAVRLADRLARERVDAIYVTSLQRTAQTAGPLAERLGLVPIVVPELREVFLGEWEGGQFRIRAEEGDPTFRRIFEEERWDVVPGAEPLEEFDARVQAGLARVVGEHPDGRVVVVSHGGVIGHILHVVAQSRRFAFSTVDNASISEVVIGPDHAILRRYNDTGHLD